MRSAAAREVHPQSGPCMARHAGTWHRPPTDLLLPLPVLHHKRPTCKTTMNCVDTRQRLSPCAARQCGAHASVRRGAGVGSDTAALSRRAAGAKRTAKTKLPATKRSGQRFRATPAGGVTPCLPGQCGYGSFGGWLNHAERWAQLPAAHVISTGPHRGSSSSCARPGASCSRPCLAVSDMEGGSFKGRRAAGSPCRRRASTWHTH